MFSLDIAYFQENMRNNLLRDKVTFTDLVSCAKRKFFNILITWN